MLGPCWQKLFALNCLAPDHSAICPATLSRKFPTSPAPRQRMLYILAPLRLPYLIFSCNFAVNLLHKP